MNWYKKIQLQNAMTKEASFAGFLKGFLPVSIAGILLGLGLSMADLQNKPVSQIRQEIAQKAEEKGYDQRTIEVLVDGAGQAVEEYSEVSTEPRTDTQMPPEGTQMPQAQQQTQKPVMPSTQPVNQTETKQKENKVLPNQKQKDEFNEYFSQKLLEREGSKKKMYDDGRGYATIGIGHMMGKIEKDKNGRIIRITPNERSRNVFRRLFGDEKDSKGNQINFENVLWGKQELSQDQIKKLVISDMGTHEDLGKKLFPKLDEFPMFVKAALLNGVYRGEYKKDYQVTKAINAGNFKLASELYLQRYDYKNAKKLGISGIIPRMNENKAAMLVYALQLGQMTKEQCVKELGKIGYKLK